MTIHALLINIEGNLFYILCMFYVAIYPVFFGFIWSLTALFHYYFYDKKPLKSNNMSSNSNTRVSVIMPVFNEELQLRESLTSLTELTYHNFEIIVVNDGSTDNSLNIIKEIANNYPIKIINKERNEGKAMALNDAVQQAEGEIILFIDADAIPDPNVLTYILPHFTDPKVAAVTGNPRVRNISSFLCCLQLMEYTSIISLIRRTQNLWGALMTVSGVIVAVSKSALLDVGGFKPYMATEDIALTWDLQRQGYAIRFESLAVIWMTVPRKLKSFIRQRMRWAKGLMEVLHENKSVFLNRRNKKLWIIYTESLLSLVWAILHTFLVFSFIFSFHFLPRTIGVNIIPVFWGGIVCTVYLFMQIIGLFLDNNNDKTAKYYFPYSIFYPLVYWSIISIIAVINIRYLFRKPKAEQVRWHHAREDGEI